MARKIETSGDSSEWSFTVNTGLGMRLWCCEEELLSKARFQSLIGGCDEFPVFDWSETAMDIVCIAVGHTSQPTNRSSFASYHHDDLSLPPASLLYTHLTSEPLRTGQTLYPAKWPSRELPHRVSCNLKCIK